MAITDGNYKFLWVSIGSNGRNSDAGIFNNSDFGSKIIDGTLDLPADQPLTAGLPSMPHVFVADEAFPLCRNVMRPFPARVLTQSKRIFNYRLSKARRTVENAFGIMSAKFRVFRKPLCLKPENVDKVVQACVCLHNFLSKNNRSPRSEPRIPEHPSAALHPLNRVGRGVSGEAKAIRESFMQYFTSIAGELPGQVEYVNRVF